MFAPVKAVWARGRAVFERSKARALCGLHAIALTCCGGCGKSQPRAVTVNEPVACPAPSTAQALFQATGDFPLEPEQAISLVSVGAPLPSLPAATRSVIAEVGSSEGVSLVDPAGPVDVLVLPNQEACPLSGAVNPPISATGPGATFGAIDAHHALLVGGASADAPSVIDLGTGVVQIVSRSLVYLRNLASVTPFGAGALVAGGESPSGLGSTSPAPFTAEVYEPEAAGGVGGFTQSLIYLAGFRANHGAVELTTGETLLIGGTDGTAALSSLEYVRPGATTSVRLELALSAPRVAPTVFRLPTGKIFVGGGFDETGVPVPSVEWLDADHLILGTSSVIPPVPLCMSSTTQGFAPLEGGAVLAVFGAAPPPNCSNVLVIRPDYTVDQAPPLSPPPQAPILLFAGASSSPVLLTSSQALRWNPWDGLFDLPIRSSAVPTESPPTAAGFSADPGLGLWLGSDGHVWGLRFDLRNVYSTNSAATSLLLYDTTETAPDRLLPSPDIQFESDQGLTLSNGASVFMTDATFADATIDFTASLGPFRLILRDGDTGLEFEVGQEGSCFRDKLLMGTLVRVVRHGGTLMAGIGNATPFSPTSCVVPPWLQTARVAVGFRGPSSDTSTISRISVQRIGSPD